MYSGISTDLHMYKYWYIKHASSLIYKYFISKVL